MYGAQRALQQLPQLVHKVPSGEPEQLLRPRLGGLMHVPTPPPASLRLDEQSPLQQSLLLMQMSFVWMQKEDSSTHVPPGPHSPEQQVVDTPPSGPDGVHGFPAEEQLVLIGVHVMVVAPPSADADVPHFCPQHSASEVQGWLSATHWFAHWPPTHESEQQSSPVAHAPPAPWQLAIDAPQVWLVGSHF
jgi:hypothetical protein